MARQVKKNDHDCRPAPEMGALAACALALAGLCIAPSVHGQAALRPAGPVNEPAASNAAALQGAAADQAIETFLAAHAGQCHAALARARGWLDTLETNPLELRAHGIKGKKKLAELLDAYLSLYKTAAPDDQQALRERIRRLAAITASPGYHDMARVNDRQFKEDSTSYLRIAFLMDRFGLDTGLYRREIARILPRLNDHMQQRGADQRMAFQMYYRHFGLAEPFPLQSAFQSGVIAARHPPGWFKQNKMRLYSLTHEIFVPFEFGDKMDADFFSDSEKAYLRALLVDLTAYGIGMNDIDITAELTSCVRYLHFTDLPVYREALQYLLENQRPEGKWGDYEGQRLYYGNYVDQAFYLHTTLVVVDALSAAFHCRER